MSVTDRRIDRYIDQFPTETRDRLNTVREIVRRAAPNADETINYQIPTFQMHGKNLVHFAGYKHHIGFYPTPSGIEAFKKELKPYKPAKGSVKFPLKDPIPFDLIEKITTFRVREMTEKI